MTTGSVTAQYNNLMKEMRGYIQAYRENRGRLVPRITLTRKQHQLITDYHVERGENAITQVDGVPLHVTDEAS